MKIKEFVWVGGGGVARVGAGEGVSVDVNGEVKFLQKCKKNFFWGGECSGLGVGSGSGGGGWSG